MEIWLVLLILAIALILVAVGEEWHRLRKMKRGEPAPPWSSPFERTTIH